MPISAQPGEGLGLQRPRPVPDPIPAPEPKRSRAELPARWPESELRLLRETICQRVPDKGDAYWAQNAVWVGCTAVEDVGTYRAESELRDLQLTVKVVGREGAGDVWDYYTKNEQGLRDLIAQYADDKRIRVVGFQIERGSIEILLIISIIKAVITIVGVILGIMQAFANYDRTKAGFNDARADCRAFVDKFVYRVKHFFDGFGGAPAPYRT